MSADPHVHASEPRSEYEARRDARAAEVARLEATEGRLANLRLALVVGAGGAAWLLRGQIHPALVLGVGLLGFTLTAALHVRTRLRLRRAERAVRYYETGLERLDYRFADAGVTGSRWLDEAHPYAVHLDVFGPGSLFQFLTGARTGIGRETLARWLLEPADVEEIEARQEAARELAPRLDLREDLAVLDAQVVEAFGSDDLVAWGRGEGRLPGGPLWLLPLGLGIAALSAGVASIWVGARPFAWILVANVAVALWLRRRVEGALKGAARPGEALRLLHGTLERIEREPYQCERLRRLGDAIGAEEPPASHRLAGLIRRLNALEARKNDLFAPVAAAVLWGTNCAFTIERWRARHGARIGKWIGAVGELEALLDLGRLTYERPDYSFPTVAEHPARFHAQGLAHPLLGPCTSNDVAIGMSERSTDGDPQLLVVTGSNMSGKSTLLRTVGVNAILAQAGAPVRARSLEMSPLAIGASIRSLDSLQEGASRFYAEIHAIKRAMDVAEARPPGLFLLDELLHGTNSHDRRIGAGSIVRGFLDRGALGIVTTHDLALAEIADELGDEAANAHFEFRLADGEIRFDYTLSPGVVQTGNALEIMRAAGLEI
ncbi:MAG: DNA mismatch repair protein MutS [Gemmatimonadetes bacterium]|nr:DNA mismatch repair protein MutS [Gemmatimonadota bacterium]